MKTITSRIGCIAAILALVFGSIGTAAEPAAKPVVDFSEDAAAGKWLSINDGVMGGVSEGGFRFTSNKTLVFSGKISLENRGGFASIRTRPADLDLDGYDTIAVRVKGDGRTYYLNLRTSSRRVSGSYRAPVKTKAETWQEVRVPLGDFKYTAFGRRVGARSPEASKIRSVGFTLADKQAGPFRLEVAWIRALKSEGAENPAAAVKTESSAGPQDIVDTAVGAGSFKTLVAAVKAAGLVDTLKGPGPFTVFAPTDDAFAKLPKGTVASLLKPENQGKLVAILTYHVVPGRLMAADVVKAAKLDTVQGSSLLVSTKDGVKIDNAGVVKTDIKTSNGVIHVIDSVLLPQDIVAKAQTAGLFKTLLAAAKAARLVGALKNPDAELTVFAPTDDAFAKLPKGTVATLLKPENKAKLAAILKYHVLPRRVLLGPYEAPTLEGGSVSIRPEPGTHVNGAKVVLADVKTTNGVVHVIDTVLLPPEKPAAGHEAARKMIEDAISRGAPLYNAGHPKACADLYEKTMRTLLAQHGAALGDYGRRRFRKALNRMSTTHGHRSQAWLLRNALDAVHLHLAGLH